MYENCHPGFAIALLGIAESCEKTVAHVDSGTVRDKLEMCLNVDTVALKVNQKAIALHCEGRQIELTFHHVLEDSRCPKAANCLLKGTARINVKINDAGSINLELDKPTTGTYNGSTYSFTLTELSPYPIVNQVIDMDSYEATIIVQRR